LTSSPNFSHIEIKREFQREVPCKWCQKPFQTDVVEFTNGKSMQANMCDNCAEERRRMERPEVDKERRKQTWDRMVGSYYFTFDPDRIPQAIRAHLDDTFNWHPDSPKGVGFLGKSRTGKSRVLFELGRRLYVKGQDVYPTSGIEFAEKVSGQVTNKDDFEWYMQRVKHCKILVLDDADKLNFTPAVEAAYYGMLEYRRRFQKPILVSVNCTGAQMATSDRGMSLNRGEPIVNRLRDLCEIIELK
jgi:DNA replication protein DnaC